MKLTDIYRTLQPIRAEYTIFPSAHGNSPGDKTGRPKNCYKKFKRNEITQYIFFDHDDETRNE